MNFTKEDLINFARQYNAFQKRCKYVANIFSKYDSNYKDVWVNHDWELDYDDEKDVADQQIFIFNETDIYSRGVRYGTDTVSFPFDLLSYTDEQIEEYASKQFNK